MTGRIVPRPAYIACDLWQAIGCDPAQFDEYWQRNGPGGTWAALIHHVHVLAGAKVCGQPIDGETCVLLEHDTTTPCYGASDVGRDEPLPVPVLAQKPQVVRLPEGVNTDRAAAAIAMCQRLGILPAAGAGWLLIPHDAEFNVYRGGPVDLAADPPLTPDEHQMFTERWP